MERTLIYGPGGSVCTDEYLRDIGMVELSEDNRSYYGGKYMLCETASLEFAQWIALRLLAILVVKE